MKEIEFYFDFVNNTVIFSDGIISKIDLINECFYYKEKEFILESDIEKDLCYFFNKRYIHLENEI
ncbi:MAG: hypothetical protein ACRC6U_02035 [Fusobacteriaceae bacterium]